MIDTATRPLDFDTARRAMIASQLRTCGVNSPAVLQRMLAVPRENYVPEDAHGFCYMDRSIALDDGGMLAQPVAHAKMLGAAAPKAGESVLVVDNGNGYLSALVAPLCANTKTIAPSEAVSGKTRGTYDLILIDGAIEGCPPALAKRLAENGRIITGLLQGSVTSLAIGKLSGKDIAFRTLENIALARLPAFDNPKGWSF